MCPVDAGVAIGESGAEPLAGRRLLSGAPSNQLMDHCERLSMDGPWEATINRLSLTSNIR